MGGGGPEGAAVGIYMFSFTEHEVIDIGLVYLSYLSSTTLVCM